MTAGTAFLSPMKPRACIARRRSKTDFAERFFTSASTPPLACIQPSDIAACVRTLSSASESAAQSASTAFASSGEMRPISSAAS